MEVKVNNQKILITGGAGFIGSNIAEELINQGNKVIVLDNFITGKKENINQFLQNKNFKLIDGDICNLSDCKKAINGVDIVLHQAALGSVPRSIKDPIKTNEINISGFLNMLIAAKDAKIDRFIFASSSSVYGDNNTLPKVEENIGNPLSPYAVTKQVNELYADVFAKNYKMKLIGLRYFNVFGKKQDPEGEYAAVIPKFVQALINHQQPTINGDGEQTRDFTYIKNVIQANLLAATTNSEDAFNKYYNIAFGQKFSLNELFNILKTLLSKFDKEIINITPKYGPNRPGDIPHSLASIEKVKKYLRYDPQYNLEQGLQEAIEWYWNDLK